MSISDRPNRIPWPPILAAGWFLIGLASHWLLPAFGPLPGQRPAGAGLIIGGVGLIGWAFAAFFKRKANILPHRAADLLITEGPFRLSRNPIYTGEVLTLFGLGVILGASGLLASAVLLAISVYWLAIRREEAHLAARFGEAWTAYRQQTRRWL
jgi:protein-S-isoprenylcysteine O-methyltransferase Ste14